MSCCCGGNQGNAGTGGALLSGTLDPQYASSAAPPQVAEAGVAAGNFPASLSSIGFWILVIVVIGGAWYADRAKRNIE